MIKSEIIKIKISSKTKLYYEKLLNTNLKVNDIVEINSIEIQDGSSVRITAICDFCNKEKEISKKVYNTQTNNGAYKFTCSKQCSLLKTKETNLEKYGVENVFQNKFIKDKIKDKILEHYGVDNPLKSIEIQNKIRKTSFEKYGVCWPSSYDDVKESVKKSNFKIFGFNYPAQNPNILNKMKKTTFEKYGVDNFSKTSQFSKILSDKSFYKMSNKLSKYGKLLKINASESFILCKTCETEFKTSNVMRNIRITNNKNICTICNPIKQHYLQNEVSEYINYYKKNIIIGDRKILKGKELDIYIPELKLAFEFNGLYWHSELYKERNYHINKTKECEKLGIQLIHIWEDDWNYKKDIVKSIILNKLGESDRIFARKCKIKEINDNKIVKEFLKINHIQGFVGSKIKLGLYYNEELVSLMTFGNLRKSLGQKSEEGYYEMLRFCNKLNTSIVGGSSKLLKYFVNNYCPKKIISYSDYSRSNGNMYEKLGFKFIYNSKPNYYYIINGFRKHRFDFRKDKLIREGFDPSKTEIQIMNDRGFFRIFDCGSKKYLYELNY